MTLVNSIGDSVNLLGHSFGGFCALEAALLTTRLRRLIVYEPSPLPIAGIPLYPEGTLEQLQALLDTGDRAGVVITMFRDLVGVPPEELELLKNSPRFPAWVAAAHTVPRETLAEMEYRFEPARFKQLSVPTLLLNGSDSPQFFKATIGRWHAALWNSQIVELPDQQHLAQVTAPELFVHEVEKFLLEH